MYPCSQSPCWCLLTALDGFWDSLPHLEADHSPDSRPSNLVAACQRKGLSGSHHGTRQAVQEAGRAEDEPRSQCQGRGRSWGGGKRGCPSQQPHCRRSLPSATKMPGVLCSTKVKRRVSSGLSSFQYPYFGDMYCIRDVACVFSLAPRGPEQPYTPAATQLLSTQDDPTYPKNPKIIRIRSVR